MFTYAVDNVPERVYEVKKRIKQSFKLVYQSEDAYDGYEGYKMMLANKNKDISKSNHKKRRSN
jgi:hypothetical protein